MIEKAAAEIAHTPAASPSMPSEKFTTFITKTSPTSVSGPPSSPNSSAPIERQRDVGDLHPREHADQGGGELPGELQAGRDVAQVVGEADEGDQRGRQQDAARALGDGQEERRGQQHAGEDRDPAQQRRRLAREPAIGHAVDRPDAAGQPGDQRGQTGGGGEGHQEAEDRVVVHGCSEDRRAGGGSLVAHLVP